MNHIPKTHYLVVLGDFNTVLRADPPFVGTEDPRRHHNVHSDSHVLQQLLRTQDLIAVNCKGGYQHTFTHGTHASRIDYILIRQPQVQYRRMQPITNAQFERNFGIHGPHHHPLLVTLPKWHAPQPFHFPLNRIDRFAMRHAYQAQLDNWVNFEARARIDYILIRQSQVQYRRMQPITNAQFERNFGIHGPHHHPLLVTLPKWHAPQPFHFPLNRIDRFAMRHAYQAQLDNLVNFEARARQLIHDMTSLPGRSAQDCMIALENQLRTLCIHYFPKRRSHRSAPSQLLSISSRMWNARREALRVQGKSLSALFKCWSHVTTFLVCHKQIRQFSRAHRRQKLESILAEGTNLAMHGQTFEWYRKIRQLCPKHRIRRIQMYDPHGMPLSPTQEIQQIEQYYIALYSDAHLPRFNTEPLQSAPFDCQVMTDALRALPSTKALAPDGLPALVWKHFATELALPVMNTFVECWMGSHIQPPSHWTTGWIHFLPKPNKTPSKPQALRPICLQHPVNKAFAGIQCQLILAQTFPTLRQLPLYAYLPSRGTRDCLLIVASHCRQVRDTCSQFRSSPNAPGMQGGLQISLDMEKAFDTVARSKVLQALDPYPFDLDVLRLIHSWLAPHKYCIPFKQLIGHITACRGIKQGSKDAPLLWTLVMSAILLDLKARFSLAWLRDHVVVYSDDVHLRWIIQTPSHALEALTELHQHVLDQHTP